MRRKFAKSFAGEFPKTGTAIRDKDRTRGNTTDVNKPERKVLEVSLTMPVKHTGLRGEIKYGEVLSRHTSWRVGGPAACYFQPADMDDLALFLSQLPADEDVYWLGLGSNLLVRDGGFKGSIICTSGVLGGIRFLSHEQVEVEAGVACPKVAKQCAKQGLKNAEFLSGIPGTMGGALAMNAGAFGGETWQIVKSVRTVDKRGVFHERTPDDFEIGYRHVKGNSGEWFVSAVLQLEAGDAHALLEKNKQLLAKRGATQPTQQPNAGSVFRNPPGDYAARLIEEAGLKGCCIGGACVSDKHANFIVNTGTATASDIETLIMKVAATVKQIHGIELIPEVCIVGQQADQRQHEEK